MPTNLSNLTPEELKRLAYKTLTPDRQAAYLAQTGLGVDANNNPVAMSKQVAGSGAVPLNQQLPQFVPNPRGEVTPIQETFKSTSSALTPSQIIGTPNDQVDLAYKGLTEAYNPIDEANIRQNTINQLQSQIDATNAFYNQQATRIQQERDRARTGALGRATAIQARSGQLGSSFGEAQTQGIEEAQAEALAADIALNEERRRQSIENLKGAGVKTATEEAERRRSAAIEGAQAKINEIVNRASRMKDIATSAAKSAIVSGMDLSSLSKSELDSVASTWGLSTNQLLAAYKDEKAVADKAAADLAKSKVSGLSEVSSGASLYNPNTGQLVFTAPGKLPSSAETLGGLTSQQRTYLNQVQDNARQSPEIKDFSSVRASYETARSAASKGDGAGDIVLMRMIAKITDPTTGVREEEFKTFESAQSTLARFGVSLTKKMFTGGRLTDFGRKQLLDQANDIYSQRLAAYENVAGFYDNQLKNAGINAPAVARYVAPAQENLNIITGQEISSKLGNKYKLPY